MVTLVPNCTLMRGLFAMMCLTLAMGFDALPASAQTKTESCSITIDGQSYANGSCEVINTGADLHVRWAETRFLYLNANADGTADGTWTGPGGDAFATIKLAGLSFADGCWRRDGTAICYASAASDLAAARARAQAGYSDGQMATIFLGLFALYLLPAIIAFFRGHPNRWVILILNVVFGATVIVWLGCLVWALNAVHRTHDPNGTHGGESGLNIAANDVARVRIEPPAAATHYSVPDQHSAQGSRTSVVAQLRELAELRTQGALDEAEFQALKLEVLNGSSESFGMGPFK